MAPVGRIAGEIGPFRDPSVNGDDSKDLFRQMLAEAAALVKKEAGGIGVQVADSMRPPVYDDRHLYYGSGGPRPEDIRQDTLGDCYFVAALASFAKQQPQRIQDAIRFDPQTKNFKVTLHGPLNIPFETEVTQREIKENIERQGGSVADNYIVGPIWPAVIETALAKRENDPFFSAILAEAENRNPDGSLGAGFLSIRGGLSSEAMEVISGQRGRDLAMNGIMPPRPVLQSAESALSQGIPVTLSSGDGSPGTVPHHVYMVEAVTFDANGVGTVTLRNPWGHNRGVPGSENPESALITVKADDLATAGAYFTVGPGT
ncbi:C2 family cysteine protease [Inquilinus sp. OTU3971]|uniref:C2 family cysteine protease n=1 Tax=Inquilinus sp. OTU3971 TaxID=3043855 RepID=UPI00313F148F